MGTRIGIHHHREWMMRVCCCMGTSRGPREDCMKTYIIALPIYVSKESGEANTDGSSGRLWFLHWDDDSISGVHGNLKLANTSCWHIVGNARKVKNYRNVVHCHGGRFLCFQGLCCWWGLALLVCLKSVSPRPCQRVGSWRRWCAESACPKSRVHEGRREK